MDRNVRFESGNTTREVIHGWRFGGSSIRKVRNGWLDFGKAIAMARHVGWSGESTIREVGNDWWSSREAIGSGFYTRRGGRRRFGIIAEANAQGFAGLEGTWGRGGEGRRDGGVEPAQGLRAGVEKDETNENEHDGRD